MALLQAYKNQKSVNTAIRPEDFLVGKGETNNLHCKVDIVEYLGQISQVTGMLNNNNRVDFRFAAKITAGEEFDLWIPPEKLLVFPKGVNTYV